MKLLNEIIELSTSEEASIAFVLRKVLVLSYELKNPRLTEWANAELDGYGLRVELPDYRVVRTTARGTFTGPFGAMIKNKPLPAILLDKEHRDFAERVYLRNGIASIQSTATDADGGGQMPWPANLILYYQEKFIEGYALQSAWLDLPKQVFVGILDTVRNRTLRFALELRGELGAVNEDVKAISPATVEQTVTNYIFGGNNVIGGTSHHFTQTGTMSVAAGDKVALSTALSKMGFTGPEIADLQNAVQQDAAEQSLPSIGRRAAAWLSKVGNGVGNAALSVATDVAKAEVKNALNGYLGLN